MYVPYDGSKLTFGGDANFTDGLYINGVAVNAGAVTGPAGSDTQIQYNDGGSLGASANLTFNDSTNTLTVQNLTVSGTTTTVNTDNLTVKDPNITLNYATGDSSSTANNAGITIQDAVDSTTDASILWKTASDTFEFSHKLTAPNLDINKNVTTTSANGAFDVSKSLLGNIHITNGAGASGSPKEAAITFQGGGATEAQAGIYVVNDSSTGTHMAFATTNSYSGGPEIGLQIDNVGKVQIPRAHLVVGTGSTEANIDIRSSTWAELNYFIGSTEHFRAGVAVAQGSYNTALGDWYLYSAANNNMRLIVPVDGSALTRNNGAITIIDSGNYGTYALPLSGGTLTGALDVGNLTYDLIIGPNTSSRDKIRLYTTSDYAIGMQSALTYGYLNDWAMTFQFNNETDRGFWWGHSSHGQDEGAMSLTTDGRLTVQNTIKINDTSNYAAPDTADHSVGTKITLFDAAALNWYALGIESSTMWFTSDANYKFYEGEIERLYISNSYFQYTSSNSSTYQKIKSTYTANSSNNLSYLYLETGNGADGYIIKNGYGTANGLATNELYLWNGSVAPVSLVAGNGDISRRVSLESGGALKKYVDTSLGGTFVSATAASGQGQAFVVAKGYVVDDYVSLIEAPYSGGANADVRIAARFQSAGSSIVFGTSNDYGHITHEPLRLDYRNNVFAKHIVGGEDAHAFTPPIDQNTSYSNHSFGSLGILHRNDYDAYITSNSYYYKTGGISTWRAKYANKHAGYLAFTSGLLNWIVTSTAPTASGQIISPTSKFSVNHQGNVIAQGSITSATISSGAITSTGQSFFGNTSGIKGTTGDATTNVSVFSFYESDGTTRQGYIGYGSNGNQTLYINSDLDSNIVLRVNGSNRITIDDTSTTVAGTISSGAITATAAGSANTYHGVIKTVNTSSDQWGHITLGGSATNSIIDNTYIIGRGSSVAARELSFHVPNAAQYSDTTQPIFRFASSGADTLMTITASTGAVYIKGAVSSASISTGTITSTTTISGTALGVSGTSSNTGKGISLYNGASSGEPTYGLMFQGTGTFGTHGSVTADWATYFTMDSTAGRGWIFRDVTNGNKASISNAGNATFDGTISSGGTIFGKANTQVGEDGTYPNYGVIGFGGTTDGYNRVFGRNSTADGLFLAAATGRGVFVRTNGANSDTFSFTSAGAFLVAGTAVLDGSRNLTAANGNFSGIVGVNKATNSSVALSVGSDASTSTSYGLEVCNSTSNTRFIVDGLGNSNFYGSDNSLSMSVKSSGKVTIQGTIAPAGFALLNIGSSGSGETRAIDIDGLWASGESKSISFNHGSLATNLLGQINCIYNGPSSSLRFGRLYHGGDSSVYTMELESFNTGTANLTIKAPPTGTTGANGTFQINTTTKGAIHVRGAESGTSGSADTIGLITIPGSGTTIQGGIYATQNSSTGTSIAIFTTDSYSAGGYQGLTVKENGGVVVNRGDLSVQQGITAEAGGLVIGADAYSASTAYVGLKTATMTGSTDYMIIAQNGGDGNTYISAKDGYGPHIRGGGNNNANEIQVPDNSYIRVTTSNLQCTGNVTAYYSSDRSLKENIRPITSALDKVHQINGVYFDWKDDFVKEMSGDGEIAFRKDDVGVIAQEVNEVLNEVVAERKDGTLAVKYEKIVPLLIEAIKEQTQMINDLQTQLKEIKNGND
jgi:hypothetical protein